MKIAHIINPFTITEKHIPCYLHVAQPTTIQSMINAKNNTLHNIELIQCVHKQDKINIANFDTKCEISRFSRDVIENFNTNNLFPLVRDIFTSAISSSDADFFIFTNTDIGLYPNFYDFVFSKIESGLDSFFIDRRTMPKAIDGITINETNFDKVFKLKGKKHPGVDCFIFKRPSLDQIQELGNVFLGATPVGTCIQYFCRKFFQKHEWFREEHLTFHLGDDRWNKFSDHLRVNIEEAKKLNFGSEYNNIINSISLCDPNK